MGVLLTSLRGRESSIGAEIQGVEITTGIGMTPMALILMMITTRTELVLSISILTQVRMAMGIGMTPTALILMMITTRTELVLSISIPLLQEACGVLGNC